MENIFGTDGIRKTVGDDPFTLKGLQKLGDAIAAWILEKYGRNATLLLAHDTRLSCGFVKAVLKSRLLLHPITIFDAQVLPSPGVVQLMNQDAKFSCGLIISASHNSFKDNGIKLIDAQHGKLTEEDEKKISSYYLQNSVEIDYSFLGSDYSWNEAQSRYSGHIEGFFPQNFLAGKKVVLDCANGAASYLAPKIFKRFGAKVIAINNQPNGVNINKNCGALYLDDLQKTVVDCQANIGFAFDGDADRVIAVNHLGQVKNGDDILAILMTNNRYQNNDLLVGTVMTNKGFELHLNKANKKLIRTPVGDKYVSQAIAEYAAFLGGESSGHIIAADYLNTGDGIFIALRILETLLETNNDEMATFVKFPQILINLQVVQKRDLCLGPLRDIINASEDRLHAGRLLVRYSGTEPLLRIMIEDDDFDHAQEVGNLLSKQLKEALI